MCGKIIPLGYSENSNTLAFDLMFYKNKEKLYLGYGVYNFVSQKTKVKLKKSAYKELALKALATNDMHLNVKMITYFDPNLSEKYKSCKY